MTRSDKMSQNDKDRERGRLLMAGINPDEQEKMLEPYPVSRCCEAPYWKPGYPVLPICSACYQESKPKPMVKGDKNE